ncbi:Protein CBG26022 [Caenorhabditis briggsae]|uniref:Protein CBG26022 n=1 Tax=Caenorhabditis briggsae TaxID=6238 RepID=B6ILG6_CAEBR|nr:Protein CBG26022 [Caenorhabditis briggsae]CAS00746.1 Protein CBG26022 [Caenorhabditis briggsae]
MNDSNRSSTISLHMIEDDTMIGKDISETNI